MFTSTGSRGLYKAPLSKCLLLVPTALTLVLLLVLPQYQKLFVYSLQAVRQHKQFWRLLCGRMICLDVKDTFCSSLLLYNFRIFERRFGTRKFASFLFGTWVLSGLLDVLLVEALGFFFELQVDALPAGMLGPVFALFVPFFSAIPRVQVTQLLGHVSVTNKSLVYIVGLQLLTSSTYMWVVAVSGLVSGVLYYGDVLRVQRVLRVPGWLSVCVCVLLERLVQGGEEQGGDAAVGMGATLDIQRQQRIDMLDQQLLLSQLQHFRRNAQQPPPPPPLAQEGGLLGWSRFFPSLRHRNQNQMQPRLRPADTPVAEEQVARLMEMGFSRVDAQEALRASNNDINMATNFLLQH